MITYFYWMTVALLALLVFAAVGMKLEHWKAAIGLAVAVLLIGWASYFFHFQQIFVKRWGGVMTIKVPDGHVHLAATWKDDNLWVENYDPATNTCHFNEYSKGNLLQGKVTIKDCNPMLRAPRNP
ncbi:MAG: hypothetical protein GY944_29960 [bacterium]|nr:hypothetical protein [bacterium]